MKTTHLFLNDDFKGGLLWLVLGLFAISVVSVSPLLPIWGWAILAGIALWFTVQHRFTELRRFNPAVMVAAVLGYVTALLLVESNWLTAQAITGFLVTVVFLKLVEIRKKSEALWIIAALIVLIGIGTLYWNSLLGFGLLLMVLFGVVFSMVVLSQAGSLQWLRELKSSAKLFVMALPLSLVLFFFIPRFDGPLWDLGLAFGVPINLTQSAPPQPLIEGNRLRSDQFASFMNQVNTVLVAEFDGKVPYKSEMYWRGPVFTHFDGLEWYLEDGALKRSELMRGKYRTKQQWKKDVQYQGNPLKYNVRVMPHGQRWLYSLETSTAGAPETFLSRDFQLLSIRPLHQEFSYDSFWLKNYRIKPELKDKVWSDSLLFPEGTHPGLKEFGAQLAEDFPDAEERILSLYQLFRDSFSKSERTEELTENYLDEVWLIDRGGSMLDIASATTLVLRASGIPARLVTGFRGGNLVALTDFVMVKQSHAHIWVEAWLEDKGWVRVEPQDYITVQSFKDKSSSVVKATELEQNQTNTESKPNNQTKSASQERSVNDASVEKATSSDQPKLVGGGEAQWWHVLDEWLVDYDSEKQDQLLDQVDSKQGEVAWLTWAMMSFGALLVLSPLFWVVSGFLKRPKTDKIGRMYARLQKQLSTSVEVLENECPSKYLQRIQKVDHQLAELVGPLIGQYLEYKYGTGVEANTLHKQFERVLGMLS